MTFQQALFGLRSASTQLPIVVAEVRKATL
jgi:hypothetical protein